MMSLNRKYGSIEVDHTASPGITPEFAAKTGGVAVAAGKKFEADTKCCSHCGTVVILNPLRSRSREYCPACFHYVCDLCAATYHETLICTPVAAQIDAIGEALVLGKPAPLLIGSGGIFQKDLQHHG
jgi:hypothetical protein